jgi:integrase
MQSEVLQMQLSQVDLAAGTLRLGPGTTKNREGRTVYLTPELVPLLSEQIERGVSKHCLGRSTESCRICSRTLERDGFKRPGFGTQESPCKKAGLIGMLRHDFRRSAVRNLVRSGVGETVAMKISGHKTRSVFDRYNITSDADLREAARKLHGHNLVTLPAVGPFNPPVSALNSSHAPVAQLDRAAVS